MKTILLYGQWIILVLSVLSLFLVSSVKHQTRLNGYILTGISRFAGALVFIFFDLFAFVIANLIQTYIAFRGYYQNKKAGEDILHKDSTTNCCKVFLKGSVCVAVQQK
tara:strand:- start:955 stop:1278 length:324 start_codon:yes stop_codon:yes gene_type:complete